MGEKSKKPLIIAILIAALVVCASIVAIAIVNSSKNSEDSIDDEDNGDEYASFFMDLAERKESLPDGFESVIADDQNYDYQSTSTDRDNSKNKTFPIAKEIVDDGNIDEALRTKKVEATARKMMNSNILNHYLDRNKIVIIEAEGSDMFEGGGAIVVYGGDLLDGTYYIYRKGDTGSEPTIISKLDLFNAIESKATFYVISGVSTNE